MLPGTRGRAAAGDSFPSRAQHTGLSSQHACTAAVPGTFAGVWSAGREPLGAVTAHRGRGGLGGRHGGPPGSPPARVLTPPPQVLLPPGTHRPAAGPALSRPTPSLSVTLEPSREDGVDTLEGSCAEALTVSEEGPVSLPVVGGHCPRGRVPACVSVCLRDAASALSPSQPCPSAQTSPGDSSPGDCSPGAMSPAGLHGGFWFWRTSE